MFEEEKKHRFSRDCWMLKLCARRKMRMRIVDLEFQEIDIRQAMGCSVIDLRGMIERKKCPIC